MWTNRIEIFVILFWIVQHLESKRNLREPPGESTRNRPKESTRDRRRKLIRQKTIAEENPQNTSTNVPVPDVSRYTGTITGFGYIYDLGLFFSLFLMLLHVFLCYKLYGIDESLTSLAGQILHQYEPRE